MNFFRVGGGPWPTLAHSSSASSYISFPTTTPTTSICYLCNHSLKFLEAPKFEIMATSWWNNLPCSWVCCTYARRLEAYAKTQKNRRYACCWFCYEAEKYMQHSKVDASFSSYVNKVGRDVYLWFRRLFCASKNHMVLPIMFSGRRWSVRDISNAATCS